MNKKQVMLVISLLTVVFIGIVVTGFLLIKEYSNNIFKNINLKEIISAFNENSEVKSNIEEVNIKLTYKEGKVAGKDNVFNTVTDLGEYYKKNEEEVIKFYPFINDKGLYGYKDINGNYVTENLYEYAEFFFEGLAVVSIDGLYGFIDSEFNTVIPCKYLEVLSWGFENGLAVVTLKNNDIAVIDKKGKVILSGDYDYIDLYYNGIIITRNEDETNYYNKFGKELKVLQEYDLQTGFCDGIAEVYSEEEGIRYINEDGKLINIDGAIEYYSFYNGTAIISTGYLDKYITINRKFEVIDLKSDYKYLYTSVFNDVHCVYKETTNSNNIYEYIDSKGEILFTSNYESYDGYIKGVAPAFKDDKFSFIDLNGNVIEETNYDNIYILNDNLFSVVSEDYIGLMDTNRKLITEVNYEEVYIYNNIIYGYKDYYDDTVDIFNKEGKLIGTFDNEFIILDSDMIFIFEENSKDYGYYINVNTGKTIEYTEKVDSL